MPSEADAAGGGGWVSNASVWKCHKLSLDITGLSWQRAKELSVTQDPEGRCDFLLYIFHILYAQHTHS